MSVANVLGVYSIFGYDAEHSEDILFIICLNLLIWAGVAMLCAVLEYNVRVHLCAFVLLSTFYLSTVTILSVMVIILTQKLAQPIRQEIFALVGLDSGCAVALVGAVGIVLVQQNMSKDKDKEVGEKETL